MSEWIESHGGPLVAVPESLLPAWRGVLGSSSGLISDYDRACEVEGYLGVVACRDRGVLVLGGEPLPTTWVAKPLGGILVRGFHAESDHAAMEVIASGRLESAALEPAGIELEVDGPLRLIDAGAPGDSLTSENLRLELQPGTYLVESGIVDEGSKARLLVHRLTRV